MSDANRKKLFLLFEKLKEDKKTLLIIAIGFLGVFLIFISEIFPEKGSEMTQLKAQNEYEFFDTGKELEQIIGKIEGVGDVEVMITYDGTSETVYAYDKSEQKNDTELKKEEEHIIIDKGNAEDGLLIKEIYPKVTGVAVVCEGGGKPTVKGEITQMLKALYGISSNCISVSEMNG